MYDTWSAEDTGSAVEVQGQEIKGYVWYMYSPLYEYDLLEWYWNWATSGWIIDNFCQILHTLCHTVTLNFYSTSRVMRLNSVQNLSEIK